METKEIIKIIEKLDEIQLNDVIIAICRAYDRTNPENELAFIALPKHNQEKRKQVIKYFVEAAEKTDKIL